MVFCGVPSGGTPSVAYEMKQLLAVSVSPCSVKALLLDICKLLKVPHATSCKGGEYHK